MTQTDDGLISLVHLIQSAALCLWKDWPREMILSRSNMSDASFVLAGECPHCGKQSAFESVTKAYQERFMNGSLGNIVAGCCCIACNKYILGIIRGGAGGIWEYYEHYPLGLPNDTAADEIPEDIRNDFKEALRCRWVDAYNATAEMCRRAIESSCISFGAPKDKSLSEMIDWVFNKKLIIESLKDMAHTIKLGGNRGAHPSPRVLGKEDADALIEFTNMYFMSVYIMPKRIEKSSFEKPKG